MPPIWVVSILRVLSADTYKQESPHEGASCDAYRQRLYGFAALKMNIGPPGLAADTPETLALISHVPAFPFG